MPRSRLHHVILALLLGLAAATAGRSAVAAAAPEIPLEARAERPVAPVTAGACSPAAPGTCGQVRVEAGGMLADDAGRWTMRGVQFFLPRFGINGKTLWDHNYAAALADGTLAYWLDKAHGYLRANMLRVYVDLPHRAQDGTIVIPTSAAMLYDFALNANARGMRLGLVLHNSADWA